MTMPLTDVARPSAVSDRVRHTERSVSNGMSADQQRVQLSLVVEIGREPRAA
jgi:hypothetical protein